MAIQIGAAEPGFNDPVGLLKACHRRIERFLGALYRVTQNRMGGELGRSEAEALETALKYFRDAAPHHTADEERDLFPALARYEAVSPEVAQLERQHRRAEELHAAVDQLGLTWLRNGTLDRHQAGSMLSALETLVALYDEHIRTEEEAVFPRASACLPKHELLSLGRRMATRRGAVYIPDAVVAIERG